MLLRVEDPPLGRAVNWQVPWSRRPEVAQGNGHGKVARANARVERRARRAVHHPDDYTPSNRPGSSQGFWQPVFFQGSSFRLILAVADPSAATPRPVAGWMLQGRSATTLAAPRSDP